MARLSLIGRLRKPNNLESIFPVRTFSHGNSWKHGNHSAPSSSPTSTSSSSTARGAFRFFPPAESKPGSGLPTTSALNAPDPAKVAPAKMNRATIPGISHVICVAAGKGGVGKSTTAVNLAMALSQKSLKVGIMDADIYGPSIPRMMNLSGSPELTEKNLLRPLVNFGVPCMSMGFMVGDKGALAWKGLMVAKAMNQMLFQTAWPNLDVLVIDMPPGTGDIQIALAQMVAISGAVLVSTPQDVALMDVRRAADMFEKVKIPMLGIVQNMSVFICPCCNKPSYIFGKEGAERLAVELNVSHLGDIPIDPQICATSDRGAPVVISDPKSAPAAAYGDIAQKIISALGIKKESVA